jgi:uncharacterized protein YoxC
MTPEEEFALQLVFSVILIAVAIILLVRGIILWYWRVNHIVDRLDRIIKGMQLMYSELQALNAKAEETETPCEPSS